jgi:phospholipase/carboxylesterase
MIAVGHAHGRLEARPGRRPGRVRPRAGIRPLGLFDDADPLLLGPTGETGAPVPLVVSLHGAGGDSRGGLALFAEAVAERDLVLLAPEAHGATWDLIGDRGFGMDVQRLDAALELLFDSFDIDPRRVILGGFSDGASYALSLGLQNGDLFTHVVAFSPGFTAHRRPLGKPALFVSHGVDDGVLRIDRCSRRLVPMLEAEGYSVRYEEFQGGHVVPRWLSIAAVDWAAPSLPQADAGRPRR